MCPHSTYLIFRKTLALLTLLYFLWQLHSRISYIWTLNSNHIIRMIFESLNKRPHFIAGETLELFLHSNHPIQIKQGLMYLERLKTRHKSMMLTKGSYKSYACMSYHSFGYAFEDLVYLHPIWLCGILDLPDGSFMINKFISRLILIMNNNLSLIFRLRVRRSRRWDAPALTLWLEKKPMERKTPKNSQ
jgi:hypothetical protein